MKYPYCIYDNDKFHDTLCNNEFFIKNSNSSWETTIWYNDEKYHIISIWYTPATFILKVTDNKLYKFLIESIYYKMPESRDEAEKLIREIVLRTIFGND